MLLETGVRDLSGLIALYLFAPPGYRVTIQNRCCYRRRGRSARRGRKKREDRHGKVWKWEGRVQQQSSARKMLGNAIPGASKTVSKTRTQKTHC